MSVTYFDCALVKGDSPAAESAFCSIFDPRKKIGSLCVSASLAARESIGGHVASKLATEHFVAEILDFFQALETIPARTPDAVTEENLRAIEAAFRRANTSVYTFGHRLAAGGRMAACLIGGVLQDQVISVGRVGMPTAYLCRGKEIYPFFESAKLGASAVDRREMFVGLASLVSVQLSSLRLEERDLVLFVSEELDDVHLNRVFQVLNDLEQGIEMNCNAIVQRLFPEGIDIDFAGVIQAGPDTIFLSEELR